MTAAHRRDRLIQWLPGDVDGVLLTRLVNVRWASGFTGSKASLLIGAPDRAAAVLATDGRYRLRAEREVPDVDLLISGDAADVFTSAADLGMKRMAIEADHVTITQHARMLSAAADRGITLVPVPALVEALRARKDADEVAGLRAACELTDATLARVVSRIKVGMTERELDWALIATMRHLGADGPSFDAIVASGPNSAIPHHRPSDRPLEHGELLTLDFGALVDGQHADMTRTVVVGSPADWQVDLHALVAQIQADLRGAAFHGVEPLALDTQAADAVMTAGYDVAHGLGHGVGFEIHEEPWLTPDSVSAPLAPTTAFTIEPGVYLNGRGGVRIEDTMLLDGHLAVPLTSSPRELISLG